MSHLIEQFRLEIEAQGEKSHLQFLSSASGFAKDELCKVLEEVLDSLGLEDRIIRIEKLEIDLGEIEWKDRNMLKDKFRSALLQELKFPLISQSHQKLATMPDSSPTKKRELSKSEERKERWEHYLKYGNLPWWDQTARSIDFDLTTDLERLIKEDYTFFYSILEKAGRDKFLFLQISRRLFQFLGEKLFACIYKDNDLKAVEELSALFKPLKSILTSVQEIQFRQETLWVFFTAPQKNILRNLVSALSSSLQLAPEQAWIKLLPVLLKKGSYPLLEEEMSKVWGNNSMRLDFVKKELPVWYERASDAAAKIGSEDWVLNLTTLLPMEESVSSKFLAFTKNNQETIEILLSFLKNTERYQEEWIPRALSTRLSSMEGLPEEKERDDTPDTKSYQWLLRYLKTGSLPWVQRQFTREDIEELIREMYSENATYFQEFFSKVDLFRFPQVWERIEKQFAPDIREIFESALQIKLYLDRKQLKTYRENVLNLFFTKGLVPWKDLLDGNEDRILEVLISYFREDPVFFQRAIRESKIIQNATLKKKIVQILGERIWKFLLDQSEEKEEGTTETKKLSLVDLMTDFNEMTLQLEAYFKSGKFISDVVPSFEEVIQALSRIKTRDARLILAVYHHRYPEQVEKALGTDWTEELRNELSFETAPEPEEEIEEPQIPEYLKPKSSQEKREKTEADRLLPEGTVMYIRNSGLVLLHPFLGRYFSMLKLTEKRAFVNDEAMERAVHLLQYLVYEKSDMPEFELTLNKIMCGMAPVLPVKSKIELTEQEKELSESLLKGVIENWTILKNTSVENFRASFLHREGRLSKEPDGWRLRVEQKGYDVLLKNIPWAYSTVKLPWMKEVIHVDWTT